MKLRYQKPKGRRLKRYFWHITACRMWYVPEADKWMADTSGFSYFRNNVPCKTVRAFRRHLRKHPEIRGKARLVSWYVGYDVFG